MEKPVRTTLWITDGAIRLNAELEDFDGTVNQWKAAFYEVWRWQMTWDFAFSIRLIERRTGVALYMLVKDSYLKSVLNMLEGLGYRNVTQSEERVGIVQTYDLDAPEAENMFEVFAD